MQEARCGMQAGDVIPQNCGFEPGWTAGLFRCGRDAVVDSSAFWIILEQTVYSFVSPASALEATIRIRQMANWLYTPRSGDCVPHFAQINLVRP